MVYKQCKYEMIMYFLFSYFYWTLKIVTYAVWLAQWQTSLVTFTLAVVTVIIFVSNITVMFSFGPASILRASHLLPTGPLSPLHLILSYSASFGVKDSGQWEFQALYFLPWRRWHQDPSPRTPWSSLSSLDSVVLMNKLFVHTSGASSLLLCMTLSIICQEVQNPAVFWFLKLPCSSIAFEVPSHRPPAPGSSDLWNLREGNSLTCPRLMASH